MLLDRDLISCHDALDHEVRVGAIVQASNTGLCLPRGHGMLDQEHLISIECDPHSKLSLLVVLAYPAYSFVPLQPCQAHSKLPLAR